MRLYGNHVPLGGIQLIDISFPIGLNYFMLGLDPSIGQRIRTDTRARFRRRSNPFQRSFSRMDRRPTRSTPIWNVTEPTFVWASVAILGGRSREDATTRRSARLGRGCKAFEKTKPFSSISLTHVALSEACFSAFPAVLSKNALLPNKDNEHLKHTFV